ncbi:GTP-binding protein [Labilibaculum sp. A4]|uniref:zinc ribbon domain-containing protein n=1 Tax=Labilibaculum euxinus TaxID=2686357 RepID=UPI000F6167DB|nr:GTP-binding protein [Labilibaculum euxinus]
MNQTGYKCPKCGNSNYESVEFRVAGGIFSNIFDVQDKKFTTMSCIKCSYTEIYKASKLSIGKYI